MISVNPSILQLSVLIPTHNPRMDYLRRVIDALKQQSLPREQWEIIVVDNGSLEPLRATRAANERAQMRGGGDNEGDSLRLAHDARSRARETSETMRHQAAQQSIDKERTNIRTKRPTTAEVNLGWHPSARLIREEELGLTFARLRGFEEATGNLIVMVDDDNVLTPEYLETAVRLAEEHPNLGAFGGKCLPEYEIQPERWLEGRGGGLGLRDLGEIPVLFPSDQLPKTQSMMVEEFPHCAPIGAGMVLRRAAALGYAARLEARGKVLAARADETITDRKGNSLASGGDNDICLTVVEDGWRVGYFPQLQLTHLIPKERLTLDYHQRMARDSMKTYIRMLDQHGIRPWPAMPRWSLPLRFANDWLRVKPWRGPEQSLRFWGHVGMYEGRAALACGGEGWRGYRH